MVFLSIFIGFLLVFLVPDAAWAWGPATHLRFASEVLINLEMVPVALRTLLATYSFDYMYGNLAADLILGKKYIDYRLHCHNWDVAFELLEKAPDEPQKAFMWGYITHLAADTIAHNIFIPSQVLRSDAPRGFKHAYWEVRYDGRTQKPIWDMAGRIQRLVDPRDDALLQSQLEETIFSHRVNKMIFNSTLFVQNMKQWRSALNSMNQRSPWQFDAADAHRYDHLAMNSIFDMLHQLDRSHTYHNDPTGQRMLDTAQRLHKEGRRMRRKSEFDPDMHFQELAPILEFDFPARTWTNRYPDRVPGSGAMALKALDPAALRKQLDDTVENPVEPPTGSRA